jgi:hypothetical protein
MKKIFLFIGLTLLASCASKPETSTSDALAELEKRYADKIGKATKSEFVEDFGQPMWCEQKPGGAENCRFYRRMGTRWKGDPQNRTHYDAYDEMLAEFDPKGFLREYKAKAQR